MKKLLLLLTMILGFTTFGQAAILDDAVIWMHNNGLTNFKTVAEYQPNNYIRRDEAAKMFVALAKLQGKNIYVKTEAECKFSDINDSHKNLKDIVVESCKLGIFQGANGKFMPRNSITNEQAIAVLVRILFGNQSETGVSYRSENYYKKATELGLGLQNTDVSVRKQIITRGNIGIVIHSANNLTIQTSENKKFSNDSLKISFQYPTTLNIVASAPSEGMIQISNYLGGQDGQLFMVANNGQSIPDGVGTNFWGVRGISINSQAYVDNFCTTNANNKDITNCSIQKNSNSISFAKYNKSNHIIGSDVVKKETEYLLYNPYSSYKGIIISTEDNINESTLNKIIDSLNFIK